MKRLSNSTSSLFLHFLSFNLCFFCLQLVLISTKAGSFISSIVFPWEVYWEFFTTLGIHISLYILLSLIQTLVLISILKRPWHYLSIEQWQVTLWSLCICAILSANAWYFPLSHFSKLFSPPLSQFYIKILLNCSVFCLSLLLLNSLIYLARTQTVLFTSLLTVILCTFLFFTLKSHFSPPLQVNKSNIRPNIIILSIDSLSPESLNTENMPFLSSLLKKSTQFTQTISPLARTYPAWCSILTGLYTSHHHAEENLVAKHLVASKKSIVWNLNQQGYNTIFATDDRRFNNLDKEFGFKKIIGPKSGVNDFLLGSFNDFPLGNLLINSRIGSWLFPYNYINRASFFSYYPETFNAKLQSELEQDEQSTPVFLAVHLTLPHWPYAWAESLPQLVNNEFSIKKRNKLYQSALAKVDTQFNTLFSFLKRQNYFNNSLFIILSDHGEALYSPDSRLTNSQNYQGIFPGKLAHYFKCKTATDLDKSAGHGSDLLSPTQYHSVMAFTLYKDGKTITPATKINTRIALIDLAPTLLDFVNTNSQNKMDGISLLQSIMDPKHALPQRTFFIESGMFPNQNLTRKKAMEIGKKFYQVNPNSGALEIKTGKLNYFEHQKLYGIIKGQWIFALYPDDSTYIPVIQNLSTGKWTDNLNSRFAKSSPALSLYQQIQQFYGKKLFLPLP